MKLIDFLMRHSRRSFLLAVLTGILSGACNTGLLAVINAALGQPRSALLKLAIVFLGLCAFAPLARAASELLLIYLGQGALYELRIQLSRQILGVPLRQLEALGAHRLMAVLTDDVPNITNLISAIPLLCVNIAVVATSLVYMGWLYGTFLLTTLVAMAVGVVSYQFLVASSFRHLRLARQEQDKLHGHFNSLLYGVKELKLHRDRRQTFLSAVLKGAAGRFREHNVSALSIYTAASSWGQMLVFAVIGLLVFGVTAPAPARQTALTGFTLCLLYLMGPMQMIMNTLPTLGRANVALRNVEQLGLTLAAQMEEGRPLTSEAGSAAPWKRLELAGVSVTYPRGDGGGSFLLGPLNLTFPAGQMVFLTGGNGSGKTTLAKLLTGLYAPESGEIRMDGHCVRDDEREQYRQQFSVVFSDFYLFESLLGLEAPELDEKATNYLARLELTHKVSVEGGRLSTTELSQGQRKRLALLTAWLEDRPVYVFDEWAADQDPVFRDIFYYELLSDLKARGKTVFVISHDDRYYHVGDRVIKFDSGQVVSDSPAKRAPVNPTRAS